MNKIGFSNFRRFAKFPEIDLGNVTVLVGGNNSGKSTIVKALLLCVDNLRLMKVVDNSSRMVNGSPLLFRKPIFRFDANMYHDVKVSTFARAIHNKPVDILSSLPYSLELHTIKALPSTITFKFQLDRFYFTFVVAGNRDANEPFGEVNSISIEDHSTNLRYTADYNGHRMELEILSDNPEESINLSVSLYKEYKKLCKSLEKANESGDLDEITSLTASTDKLIKQMRSMVEDNAEDSDSLSDEDVLARIQDDVILFSRNRAKASYDVPFALSFDKVNETVVENVISNFLHFIHVKGVMPEFREGQHPDSYSCEMSEYKFNEEAKAAMALEEDKMKKSLRALQNLIQSLNIYYIPAHAANQKTLYTRVENDYMFQTIHNFFNEKIEPGTSDYKLVQSWMQRFGIGTDFEIISIDGDAYRVNIKDEFGSKIPLADKGMGSIQLMLLLLKLATIMHQYRRKTAFDDARSVSVIIEEPEQNLHPKMQSRLADLFHSLSEYEEFNFVIETHSEYLLRRTQVIVANENYEDEQALKENNKFKVYYLPEDENPPYEMHYDTTGAFIEKFGSGFFDAASESDMVIIRKEFEKKKKSRQ